MKQKNSNLRHEFDIGWKQNKKSTWHFIADVHNSCLKCIRIQSKKSSRTVP